MVGASRPAGHVKVSLTFEPVLVVHIAVGLLSAAMVVAHLMQRRRVSDPLAARLLRACMLHRSGDRLAVADELLAALTIGMILAGLWDWSAAPPIRIRWHAITGVVLAGCALVHTLRRRARLRAPQVR